MSKLDRCWLLLHLLEYHCKQDSIVCFESIKRTERANFLWRVWWFSEKSFFSLRSRRFEQKKTQNIWNFGTCRRNEIAIKSTGCLRISKNIFCGFFTLQTSVVRMVFISVSRIIRFRKRSRSVVYAPIDQLEINMKSIRASWY